MENGRITDGTLLLYGGTFAPPHLGHVHAVRTVHEILHPDCVLIMPTAVPPHKQQVKGDTAEIRLEMCRAAFEEIPDTYVSSYEIDKGGVSYTVDTLEYLKTKAERLLLLCGSDMFLTLGTWRNAQRIFELASIVCMPRYKADTENLLRQKLQYEKTYGGRMILIENRVRVLSSTEVRQKIVSGEDLTDVLPKAVIRIIRREKLYLQEETE
ncbi:MAG: nicotinate (nicotinamide) nucleotide adenylyltransferase [Clostridia bacterium]|nr:nicotinate (nicotinamide) nucleotide adenylyltransferase [Clostridia bacterium]